MTVLHEVTDKLAVKFECHVSNVTWYFNSIHVQVKKTVPGYVYICNNLRNKYSCDMGVKASLQLVEKCQNSASS